MRKSAKKSKSSYHHGNLREVILRTSLKLVETSGLEALSIRKVAKATGVTHQAPYRHFKDRESLLAALAEDGFDKLFSQIDQSLKTESDPFRRLLTIGESYLQWAAEHPDHFRLMFNQNIPEFETSLSLKTSAYRILNLVVSVIDENQKAQVIRKEEPRLQARKFWAVVHGVSILFIDRQFKPLKNDVDSGRKLAREIVSNLVKGLK